MYRLLIVDDEQMIVDWLYRLFVGLTHLELDIYKANSGREAVNLLQRMKMDIVMTDIRMPEMNGLQLLEIIKDNWSQCRVIFLTGYNEFDYVYSAIKHDGVSYLMKTETDQVIINSVEKAIEEIEKTYRDRELFNRAVQQMNAAMPLLQREYLLSLLYGDESVFPVSQQQLDDMKIPLRSDRQLILLLCRIDNLSRKLAQLDKSHLIYAVKETIEEYLLEDYSAAYVSYEDSYLLWFIQIPDSFKGQIQENQYDRGLLRISENLDAIQKVSAESLNAILSFAVAGEPVTWEAASQKAFALKQLLISGLGFEHGIIRKERNPIAGLKGVSGDIGRDAGVFRSQLGKVGTLQNYLDRGQKKDFFDLFGTMAKSLEKIQSMHSVAGLEIYFSLSLMFLSHINRCNISEKLAFKTGIFKLTRTDEFDSWKDAAEYLGLLAEAIFELQDSEAEKRNRDTVSQIRRYILEHLTEDISLVKLSELVYFNPSYLSRLFKQMTGMNITDFIHDVRLGKAKELLTRKDMKIQEIAAALGYESAPYFSKFFKRATNLTPQEYRDTLIKM